MCRSRPQFPWSKHGTPRTVILLLATKSSLHFMTRASIRLLMVSELVSGSSGEDTNLAWSGTLHYVLEQDTLIPGTVSLSTQEYKWVPANLKLGVTL